MATQHHLRCNALQHVGTDHLKHELDLLLSFDERFEGHPRDLLGAHAAAQR